GGSAVTTEVNEGINSVAHVRTYGIRGGCRHYAGKLMAGNAGQAVGPVACGIGPRPGEFGRRDSARMNAHKCIAIFQCRLRRIFVEELLRAAAHVEADRFHGSSLLAILKSAWFGVMSRATMSLLSEWRRMNSVASLKLVPGFRRSSYASSQFPSAPDSYMGML